MTPSMLQIPLDAEEQIVVARREARDIASSLGFAMLDQTRIASAVSEIARNAFEYASGGVVTFAVDRRSGPPEFVITIRDRGPGIAALDAVLDGSYRSSTGMGLGITGSRRLMDRCEIDSSPAGTTVTLARRLPAGRAAASLERADGRALPTAAPRSGGAAVKPALTYEEMQRQNHELLATLTELAARQDDLTHLTNELEATNRGVVALYAELDGRAEELRRVDSLKTRFLSDVSHELRTPLASIRALSNLLLNRLDGELTDEQERQVLLIRKSAEDLTDIVNDLLDLAKIEAGRVDVLAAPAEPQGMFDAIRATVAPLLSNPEITLQFDDVRGLPTMWTDEAKLMQILRNFLSNALKFTERGEIRVSGTHVAESDQITFTVSDTGIGIDEADQDLVFEAFGQVRNHLQQHVTGTGLGLPLCRNLAVLMGGEVGVRSRLGVGSTFYVTLPIRLDAPTSAVGNASDGTTPVAQGKH